ncbi:MAG TPA: hypothetical protein DIS62_01395, partial [Candidatus Kerfeldbacteria bacterium]|nr:hypothetical protein [Candidatus Kerfeldbacteria bacterium]
KVKRVLRGQILGKRQKVAAELFNVILSQNLRLVVGVVVEVLLGRFDGKNGSRRKNPKEKADKCFEKCRKTHTTTPLHSSKRDRVRGCQGGKHVFLSKFKDDGHGLIRK